jgi:large subunit ribosomal protein L7/L12
MNNDEILSAVETMSVAELNALVKAIEEKFGVSASAMMAAPAASAGGDAAPVEEKDSFNVFLKSAGDQKIAVIKVIREATGKGLKESKDVVDGAPIMVKEALKKAEAEELKGKLEAAGAVVELQ